MGLLDGGGAGTGLGGRRRPSPPAGDGHGGLVGLVEVGRGGDALGAGARVLAGRVGRMGDLVAVEVEGAHLHLVLGALALRAVVRADDRGAARDADHVLGRRFAAGPARFGGGGGGGLGRGSRRRGGRGRGWRRR